MKRTEVNLGTSEVVQIEQFAIKDASNTVRVLDVGSDIPAGFVQISDAEAVALTQPAPPPPLEQIRALEQQYADAQAKVTRQLALKALLDEAMTYPQAAGLTRDQVHTVLITNTESTYAKLFDLEAEVEKLRAQL
jgi:hypothetical protein